MTLSLSIHNTHYTIYVPGNGFEKVYSDDMDLLAALGYKFKVNGVIES